MRRKKYSRKCEKKVTFGETKVAAIKRAFSLLNLKQTAWFLRERNVFQL